MEAKEICLPHAGHRPYEGPAECEADRRGHRQAEAAENGLASAA